MSSQNRQNPKVFISYSWEPQEYRQYVENLAKLLRHAGIDCDLDKYHYQGPLRGWPGWMIKSISNAKYVLVVCNQQYKLRYDGNEEHGKGQGVKWEGRIIEEEIRTLSTNGSGNLSKFIAILFSSKDKEHIPVGMSGLNYYTIDPDKIASDNVNAETIIKQDKQYENLYRHLTEQPEVEIPHLGKIIPLQSSQSSSVAKKVEMPLPKTLEQALWYFNHSEQVALFECLSIRSGNVVGFRIQTSHGKNIPLFWLLKCLVKPLEYDLESNVSYARLPLDSQMYANNFQVLLDDIVEKLRLPKCPRKAPVEKIIKAIREIMLQDHKHIILLFDGVDYQAKSYLDKILNVLWIPLIKELETVNNINCRLLMCWIDYKKNVDWRDIYKFPDEPSEDDNNKLMNPFNLCLKDKIEHSDLDVWVKGQNGRSAIAKCKNYDLVKDEKINNIIETIWSASQDGEPRSLLQAIYNLCNVPWKDHEDRWQNF